MSLYKTQHELIQIEISLEKVEALFSIGELCAADIHCLNCRSKKCIWNICLRSCARKMNCSRIKDSGNESCLPALHSLDNNSNLKIKIKRKHLPQLV